MHWKLKKNKTHRRPPTSKVLQLEMRSSEKVKDVRDKAHYILCDIVTEAKKKLYNGLVNQLLKVTNWEAYAAKFISAENFL